MNLLEQLQKDIDKAKSDQEAKEKEYLRIQQLAALYPDLERFEGRWKRVVYMSTSVNILVTHVFFRYNCGCCDDSPLEAWPYLNTECGEVYSKPAVFYVGEKHWVSGSKPNSGWASALKNNNIPDNIIELIRNKFRLDRDARIAMATEGGDIEGYSPEQEDIDPVI